MRARMSLHSTQPAAWPRLRWRARSLRYGRRSCQLFQHLVQRSFCHQGRIASSCPESSLRPTPSWGCVPTRVGMVRAAVASFSSAASSPHPRGDGPRALLILREYLHGCWGCRKLTTLSSLNLLFEISMQIREKRLSPRPAPGRRPLLPLSPKRTRFAQNHSFSCLAHARSASNPRASFGARVPPTA
jgi:hypothetical protein